MSDVNRSIKVYIDNTEAGKSIDGLRAHIAKLEKDLNNLNKDDPAYAANAAKMKKSLEDSYSQLAKYRKSVQETERVLGNLSGSTYKELVAVQKQVERELKSTSRGTEEYNQKLAMHKKVSKEVAMAQKEMRTELGAQGTMWSRMKGFITSTAAGWLSAGAALLVITSSLAKYREERDKLESGQKELKALTGLDDASVDWLTENAKRLSGNMTADGVRIKQSAEQILEAYRIVGGEKPELLDNKEALASVTEEVLILAAASKMDLVEATRAVTLAMNQYGAAADEASRYTNVLAAGSKEGAAEVDSQAQAIKRAGVSAAAANIPIEQLVGTIQTLAEKGIKDEVAGTGLKKFFLTLQTGADDTNPKVVGLYTALDNLAKKQMEASDIKKMFGEEGYNVASVLINETEKVKAYTTAVTGTSVAIEQAAINSDTAEARRAQRQNSLINQGVSLLEKLYPSIEKVEVASASAAEALMNGAKWLIENGKLVASLVITLGTYIAVVRISTAVREANTAASLKGLIVEKAQDVALRATIAAEYAASAVKLILTGNIKAATVAMRGLLVTLGINPIVAIGVAIAALTVGIYKLTTKTTEMQRSQKLLNDVAQDAQKSLFAQKTELESYIRIARDDTKSKASRFAAIKKLNEISPEYLGNLTLEEINTKKATTAINQYVESITTMARAQAAKDKLVDIEKQKLALEMDPKEFDDLIPWYEKLEVGFMRMFSGGAADQAMTAMVARGRKTRDDLIASLDKDAETLKGIIDKSLTLPGTKTPDDTNDNLDNGLSASELKKANDAKLSEIDRYIAEKKLKISRDFDEGKILYEERNRQLEALELESLNKKLSIYGVGSDERNKIEQMVLDYKSKMMDKGFEEYLKNLEKERKLDEKKKTEKKKHYEALNDILQDYSKKLIEEQAKIEAEELEKKKNTANALMSFGADIGQIIGESLSDSEATFAETMGNILLLTLDTLRQIATMAIAERTIKNIGTLGPLGILKSVAEIALINAAFYAVKGIIKKPSVSGSSSGTSATESNTGSRVANGYSGGGYTGNGAVMDVAGVVHRGEYVVPAWQMQEPASFNYVQALEGIRQTRIINNASAGYASGGPVTTPVSPSGVAGISNAMAKELITLLRTLNDKGIDARVVLSQLEKAKAKLEQSQKIGSK